jgi:hypothetical protein
MSPLGRDMRIALRARQVDVWMALLIALLSPLHEFMWVPAGLIFTAGGLIFFVAWLRESDRRAAFGSLLLVVGLAIAASHCRSREDQLVQVRDGLHSLEATLGATAGAWLDRSLSSREAYTVLERTYQLVEDQRSAIAKDPRMLADPIATELSERAERLARAVALVSSYVEKGNADAVRGLLAELRSRSQRP